MDDMANPPGHDWALAWELMGMGMVVGVGLLVVLSGLWMLQWAFGRANHRLKCREVSRHNVQVLQGVGIELDPEMIAHPPGALDLLLDLLAQHPGYSVNIASGHSGTWWLTLANKEKNWSEIFTAYDLGTCLALALDSLRGVLHRA